MCTINGMTFRAPPCICLLWKQKLINNDNKSRVVCSRFTKTDCNMGEKRERRGMRNYNVHTTYSQD